MADASLYNMDGNYSFYQKGKYFYSAENGDCVFYQQGNHFYSIKSGERLFYKNGEYLYSSDGAAIYCFR